MSHRGRLSTAGTRHGTAWAPRSFLHRQRVASAPQGWGAAPSLSPHGGGSGGGLNPAGPPRGAPGDDKGSGAQNLSPGGRNWAPRKGRRALAAKGAQHRPPCPLCMIHPALHGATGDMGTRTGVGTERTEPGRRRALTSGTAWPQPRGSSCWRSLPGAVSSELGTHRAPRRGNEG